MGFGAGHFVPLFGRVGSFTHDRRTTFAEDAEDAEDQVAMVTDLLV
jgi:hypothetical protein